ncbi:MAG: hypothetical protein ACYCZX_08480 [Rhodospirillaceae bacterium]
MNIALQADKTCNPIVDSDIDSLFILPLRIIPFKTEALARARLVKNSHIVGVLELYSERETGSGQVSVRDLPQHFRWKEGAGHPDLGIIYNLAPLPSYDVYSLRRTLRDLGIPVNNYADLKLSEEKNKQLTGYMSRFTLPLIKEIYGDDSKDITRFEDIVTLFKDPDVKKAIARLKQMAEKLQTTIDQIPTFLENYGDIFMSLSYYNHCLDRLTPLLEAFIYAMQEMRKSMQVRNDRNLLAEMDKVEKLINGLINFLKRTFADFGTMSQDMWNNLTAAKFEQVKAYIESTQVKVGTVLCGLTVKMNAWVIKFPNPRSGGPGAKGEFIMTDMRQGLAEIVAVARGQAWSPDEARA